MKLSAALVAVWVAVAVGQMLDCTEDVLESPECYEVIQPVACYNQYRWNTQTFTCINGSDAEKKAKFCKCAKCMGTPMVNWVTKAGYCGASTGAGGKGGKRAVHVNY
ncbi:hypothetical protein QBC47DRAFT_401501 [Echria macrotheca]|uniref:Uncharacterized protein n=1 Tax=Echria macrotheca TaxID=438768 RepID=A0AAJ0BEN7_9PEZI|nr:hypothetical protein QBC47DRAFT_401501 [Echria macrotheca]